MPQADAESQQASRRQGDAATAELVKAHCDGAEEKSVMNDMASRTRPGRRDPDEASLRALRNATFDYMLVLNIGVKALTDEAIEHRPDLAYLRSQMRAALRQDRISSFSNPAAIMGTLARLLGETEHETGKETTT